jgi:hypothetical protein
MKRTLLLRTKILSPYLPSQCGEVTEICRTALPTQALRAVQVRLKSVSNEGHFTLEAETNFRPYLPSHCSGVTDICHLGISAHALRAVSVRLKSVSNEGHFTLQATAVSRPYVASYSTAVNQETPVALALQRGQFRSNSTSKEWHFTLEAESFFSVFGLVLQRGDSNNTCAASALFATTRTRLVEIVQ